MIENLQTILIVSKMGLFKCWDLLEVITDPSMEAKTQNLTRFKLSEATKEITAIAEM